MMDKRNVFRRAGRNEISPSFIIEFKKERSNYDKKKKLPVFRVQGSGFSSRLTLKTLKH